MTESGGNKVTAIATPDKALFNSFLAQVKLAAIPAAIEIRKDDKSISFKEFTKSISFILKGIIAPIKAAVRQAKIADRVKIIIDLKKVFQFKIVIDREIDKIGDNSGATNIPPIMSGILFFIMPIVTIKVASASKR